MHKPGKTPTTIFLTFLVTSLMYTACFVAFPAFSKGVSSLSSILPSSDGTSELKQKLNDIDYYLDEYYIDKADEKTLTDKALKGYVSGLGDVYSQYYTKSEYEELTSEVSGNYKGVGIEVTIDENNQIVVLNAYNDAPAHKAGIRPGDLITKVNDTSVNGENYDLAINMMKGVGKYGKTDTVRVTVKRGSEIFETDISREEITVQSVSAEMLPEKIGYVKVSTFGEETDEQFVSAVNSLITDGAKSLIIDLRNNGGGLLDTVVNMADFLLPKGDILTIKSKSGKPDVFVSDENSVSLPLCVLINQNSASASEVLAGALKDHKKAILVGETSYGKGVVQTLFKLKDGSGLKLTTAKYYTPSGVCIDKKGIKPDVEVKMELERHLSLYEHKDDIQLQEAIKQLTK